MEDERSIHLSKRTDKTYVSPRIDGRGVPIRIASKVFETNEPAHFATERGELVIRIGSKSRQEIVAKFHEDNRGVYLLTFQKWNADTGKPYEKSHFSFRGGEVAKIVEFLHKIQRLDLSSPEKINVTDEQLNALLLSGDQARRLVTENEELFAAIAGTDITAHDVVALGYRKAQLDRFDRLLRDETYFAEESRRLSATGEGVWQAFFEANTWIFGYGLCYLFLSELDGKKLEQAVSGFNLRGEGKRSDGVMKTRALISSLCFVEIKKHTTPLLQSKPYRSGAWAASNELAGGIAQSQATVEGAIEHLTRKYEAADLRGDPTGETLFNFEPRSFLVVGKLDEFIGQRGVNQPQYRSFELLRRNVHRPEIITFDELYERARFIVEARGN